MIDKAKAYDEALERAKEWKEKYSSTISSDGTMIKDFDSIFPELAEDENERIRKGLIALVEEIQRSDKYFAGISLKNMLAWLEKQDKQKSIEWNEEDKEALDMCLNAIPKRWKTKSGILLTKWLKDNIHLQPKQEWDTHDKAIVNCIVCCLDGQFVPEMARKQALEWFNKHCRDFLNSSS